MQIPPTLSKSYTYMVILTVLKILEIAKNKLSYRCRGTTKSLWISMQLQKFYSYSYIVFFRGQTLG